MCETFMIQRTAVVGMNMIVRAETAVCCVLNVLYIQCRVYATSLLD